jgi:hypothetical protein
MRGLIGGNSPTLRRSLILLGVLNLIWLSGCEKHTVFLNPHTKIFRLAKPTKAEVFYLNEAGKWEKSTGKVELPAGHYVLPPIQPEKPSGDKPT